MEEWEKEHIARAIRNGKISRVNSIEICLSMIEFGLKFKKETKKCEL